MTWLELHTKREEVRERMKRAETRVADILGGKADMAGWADARTVVALCTKTLESLDRQIRERQDELRGEWRGE